MKNDANMERLVEDVRTLSHDAGAVLRATSDVAGEKLGHLRERLSVALASAKATCHALEQNVIAGAKATDRTVRAHPYESLGIALGVGVLIGLLIGRR